MPRTGLNGAQESSTESTHDKPRIASYCSLVAKTVTPLNHLDACITDAPVALIRLTYSALIGKSIESMGQLCLIRRAMARSDKKA